MTYAVYAITASSPPVVYVGKTVNPQRRWAEHRAFQGPDNHRLYSEMRLRGKETFTFTVKASNLSADEAKQLERDVIRSYADEGYTLLNGNLLPKYDVEEMFVVRPCKASALEAVWDANDRNAAAMREIIHSWAVSFTENVKQSEQGENNDA